MSNFKLNLPTDVPWERICVTEDMIDKAVCDNRLPAKWQTSLAVFKYRPDDEYQLYPKYNITYLKVTATITGYQPLDQEIQGRIDWNGVDVSTVPGLTDLLNSYNPCHGAILQVVVGPHEKKPDMDLSEYPFFMDFEPKKRELYELATDTKEKQSRSIESLNITKSAGATQSMEILDVDMGGGGFGAQAQYAGTGGGFTYSAPNGQWGTKRLNAEESLSSRSSDVAQERRETYSFSTQISQMYHLLDSYHLGTNRVVFFVQPRPHTLEEPSGFVRGPRPVEGIQEFFLIVAQLKDQQDFCVSLRLDTSHLTKTPVMDYERKSETTAMASCTAPVATDHDIPAERIVGARACFFDCWDVHYQCYRTEASDSVTYNAPSGFRIEGYDVLVNDSQNGSTSVVTTPNGASLNVNVSAHGHKCYEGSEVCVDCPDTIQAYAGHARMQVQVNLISTTPTKQIGEEEVLMITTRGLCCCSSDKEFKPMDEYVVGFKNIPNELKINANFKERASTVVSRAAANKTAESKAVAATYNHGTCKECADKIRAALPIQSDAKYTIRQANELSNYIKTETLKSLNDPTVKLRKFVDTDFFAKQLEYKLIQYHKGRAILDQSIVNDVSGDALQRLEKFFGKNAKEITRKDLLTLRSEELSKKIGLKMEQVQKIKLGALGVKFTSNEDKENNGVKGTGSKKAD
ncbi:homeobox domain-containing protein [Chryseosolibacter indicus]|uniref:Homeobox domain-containing protein n=1 Tax=Chryseosolibacter indicus TaxID=2782351 RepID=A0ABS5VU17_9BACT|nr:homeobox domain-containing protein [Chryseosolibacter indicus]MBT1704920.1 homeobox domain-containing protein [Chryseosolibacter indicus]